MKRLFKYLLLISTLLLFAACEGVVPPPEPDPDPDPVGPTPGPEPTPTPEPQLDTIVVGICYSGMKSTTKGYYDKCFKPLTAKCIRFSYYALTDQQARDYVASVDAIISPGSTANDTTGRGTYENRVIQAALDAGKPILGICYGHQRLNKVLGGVTSAVPASDVVHKDSQNGNNVGLNTYAHIIRIDKNSTLYRIMGETEYVWVNTSHEYSVTTPGKGVTFTAWADDGIVEALEGDRFLGVQFHPEVLYGKMGDSRFLPIFEYLVKMAREVKAGVNP